MNSRIRLLLWPLAGAALLALGWTGFAPLPAGSPERLFEIPKGTYARRMSGEKLEILPSHIRLTLGVRNVLLLRNLDDVPQIFGPTLMMPGQSFRLPFEKASEYQFICTAHASGQITIVVEPEPVMPWQKIHWRWLEWQEKHGK